MAFLERYLKRASAILVLLLAGLLSPATIHAQPAPKPPVTFRAIALGVPVSDLFYDLKGESIAVTAGSSGLSSAYVVPPSGRVVFYRVLPPEKPGEKPRHAPVTEVQVGEGGPYLVVMMVNQETSAVAALVVEDSWETHPVKTTRVFNFSRRLAMVKMGESLVELPTTKSHIFTYAEGGQERLQVRFQVATKENENWVLRVGGPQVTLPKTRSTIVLIDQPPSPDRANPVAVLVRNFIEFEPAPPAAP